jgi:hypothetical protein
MTSASDYSSAKIDKQTYAEISLIAVTEGRSIKALVTAVWEAYKNAHPDVARTIAAVQPAPAKTAPRKQREGARKKRNGAGDDPVGGR